jgi:hypothetical protein
MQRILVALNKSPWKMELGGVNIQVSFPHGCQSLSPGAYLILKDKIRSAAFSYEDKVM